MVCFEREREAGTPLNKVKVKAQTAKPPARLGALLRPRTAPWKREACGGQVLVTCPRTWKGSGGGGPARAELHEDVEVRVRLMGGGARTWKW